MLRFVFRPALLLLSLLLPPVLLIQAQPYDASALNALLVYSSNCAAPCFLDIEPGVTGSEEAIAALEGHPWVDRVIAHVPQVIRGYGPVAILPPVWSWTGSPPAWVDRAVEGQTWVMNNTIDYLELKTHLRLGDWQLTLGQPDIEMLRAWEDGARVVFIYSAWYDRSQIELIVRGNCPAGHLFEYPVTVRFRTAAPDFDRFMQYAACPRGRS
jgi:hypothetical protein